MSIAVTRRVERDELDANAVLKQGFRLYRRFFGKTVTLALGLFAVTTGIGTVVIANNIAGIVAGVATLALAFAGNALLQGALVELVRDQHDDGDRATSFGEVFSRCAGRLPALVSASLLTSFGIALGMIALIVPGLVLATRWVVTIPVVMLEDTSGQDALTRSREIVRGNEWQVFKVLFGVWALALLVHVPLGMLAAGHGALARSLLYVIGSALTIPFAAHTTIVMYYALTQPERPIVLDPGERWESIWDDQPPRAA